MFRTVFKHRKSSREESPEKEDKSAEAETPDEAILAQPVPAETAPSGELEAAPVAEERVQDVLPQSVTKEAEGEQGEGVSSSLASLFSQTEHHEESGISALLDLVPDTTIQELLGDMEEIKTMLRRWLPEQ